MIQSVSIALLFNCTDIVSGVIGAVKNNDIKSAKLRDGFFKKVGFLICYFVAWLVDTQGIYVGFNFDIKILPLVIIYVCTTELVSILENISKINPDILPEKLMNLFQITNKEE